MRWKYLFVSVMTILCLFLSTSISNAENWYWVGYSSKDGVDVYVDSSSVYCEKDSSGHKNYNMIHFYEKTIFLDKKVYLVSRCLLSVPDRRIYYYEYTYYDYDGNAISSGNWDDGYNVKIIPGIIAEDEMGIVRYLAHYFNR